jgi:hypothetical protein
MKIHYLQHVPFENPGIILDWAEKNGHIVPVHVFTKSDNSLCSLISTGL